MANQPISGKGSFSIGPFTISFDNATLINPNSPLIGPENQSKKEKLMQERDSILERLAKIKTELDSLGS
ncbi:MAG: hypothetical protein WC331_10030 [Candidatus Omnitrophota bacterium]|jgi:hypothetical protein